MLMRLGTHFSAHGDGPVGQLVSVKSPALTVTHCQQAAHGLAAPQVFMCPRVGAESQLIS